jgi:excisionase family DNA binding protein
MKEHLLLQVSLLELRQVVREEVRRVFTETGLMKAIGLHEELLDVDQAASFLKLKKGTINTLFSKGKLPGLKKGKRTYFRRTELLNYLESGRRVNSGSGNACNDGSTFKAG